MVVALLIAVVTGGAGCGNAPSGIDPPGAHAPAVLAPPAVEEARLMATLRELPAPRAVRGDAASRANLVETEQYIFDRLEAMGLEPSFQTFTWDRRGRTDPQPWRNVIVDLPGRVRPDEVLLFAAHPDTVAGSPGADDNGTGVAALLEMARVLKDEPLERTLRLCFFNLEEVGLIGARHYASVYQDVIKRGEERCVGMVSIDMLGYYSDEPDSQASPFPPIEGVFEPRTVGDFVALVGVRRDAYFIQRLEEEMEAGAEGLIVERVDFSPLPLPDLMRSDHAPFYLMGIPAVMMTDTANFRNPHYHQPTDTIETIDAGRFTLAVRGVVEAARVLTRVKDRGEEEAGGAGGGEGGGEGAGGISEGEGPPPK